MPLTPYLRRRSLRWKWHFRNSRKLRGERRQLSVRLPGQGANHVVNDAHSSESFRDVGIGLAELPINAVSRHCISGHGLCLLLPPAGETALPETRSRSDPYF